MEIRTESGRLVSETAMACGWSEETGTYALASAVNALGAANAVCESAEAQIMFPVHAENTKAYALEKNIRKLCRERGIDLQGIKLKKQPFIEVPAVMISGAGRAPAGELSQEESFLKEPVLKELSWKDMVSQEIVLVKWIGMEGMLRIMEEKEEELRQRFAPVFIRKIHSYKKELFAGKELAVARAAGAAAARQITEGGIFAALWELAKETGAGLDLDIKRMSILQETVEVCEHYRVNPYQLASVGSFLMLTGNGKKLTDALRDNQIEASVIGRLTEGNDKVIHNGEDVRYLDRPAPDEIYKILLES